MKKILLFSVFILILSTCVNLDTGRIDKFYNYPNPFGIKGKCENTTFRIIFDDSDLNEFDWKIEIYNENRQLTYVMSGTDTTPSSPKNIAWTGTIDENWVRNGVYTSILTIDLKKDGSNNDISGSYESQTKTVIGACP